MKNTFYFILKVLFVTISLKNQNSLYPWMNGLKFYAICFYYMLICGYQIQWNEAADHLLLS